VIHGAVHRARKDVTCVLHTHTRAGMAVAAMKRGLPPISQTSIRFEGHIGYHDYEGPAVEPAERERLVLEPAMLRLLEAEQKSSAFPPSYL